MTLPSYVKFYRGTPESFNKLKYKDNDTLYFIAKSGAATGQLYLGSKLIDGTDLSQVNISDLANVDTSKVLNNDILAYDASTQTWVATNIETLLTVAPTISETKVFEGVIEDEQSFDDFAASLIGNASIARGDIIIAKRALGGDYSYTSYVYNGSQWRAMDGNYNAENVYFDEDLLTTSPIGNISLTNGQATIAAEGKNLKQVFETIFVKEQNPKVTQPKVLITLNEAGSYEVGTRISPTYIASLNPGNYTYGPTTKVVAKSWSIVDTNGNSLNSISGSLNDFTVEDDTNYSVTATATHNEGDIPVTNLNNKVPSLQIKEGTKSATSSAIKGYRNSFYGAVNEKNEVNSALIRGLTKSNKSNANGDVFEVEVPIGAFRVIIAYPATLKDLTSIQDSNDSMANIISSFVKTTVDVKGANEAEAISYKVYYIDFANAYDTKNTFIATI